MPGFEFRFSASSLSLDYPFRTKWQSRDNKKPLNSDSMKMGKWEDMPTTIAQPTEISRLLLMNHLNQLTVKALLSRKALRSQEREGKQVHKEATGLTQNIVYCYSWPTLQMIAICITDKQIQQYCSRNSLLPINNNKDHYFLIACICCYHVLFLSLFPHALPKCF